MCLEFFILRLFLEYSINIKCFIFILTNICLRCIIVSQEVGGVYMYKAYKFRLYPDSTQKHMLSKTFGCVRLIDKCMKNGYIRLLTCVEK